MDVEGTHPIRFAAELGQRYGGPFAAMVFEEMEIAYLLKAARHPTYTSGFTKGRVRENLMFVGPPGWGRSFATDTFIKECMGAIPYSQSNEKGLPKPRFVQIDGSAVTTESMRGGATLTGRPILPLILCADFFYSTDMTTFLGTGEGRQKALNMLLIMGEDAKMDVIQLKMEELSDAAAKNFQEACESIKGMSYIAHPRRGYRLEAASPFILCTTQNELKGGRGLEQLAPGVLSRFTIRDYMPSDAEAEEAWDMASSDVDCSKLRDLNLTIWRTPIHSLPFPPDHLIRDVKNWFLYEAKGLAGVYGQPLASIVNRRYGMRIARLMTASAIARVFEKRRPGDTTPIKELTYDEKDGDFAKNHMEYLLATLAERLAESGDDGRDDTNPAIQALLNYVRQLRTEGKPFPTQISRNSFRLFLPKVSPKTLANYMSDLKKAGVIKAARGSDDIEVDATWLRSKGFRQPVDTMEYPSNIVEEYRETEMVE